MSSRHRSHRSLAVVAAMAMAGLACGSSTDYGSGGSNPPPSADVQIVSGASTKGASAFNPNPFTVALGGAASVDVKWGNADGITHTVTADGASPLFNSGNVGPGKTFTFSFTAAGTYNFHCSIHPTMVGTIQVTP
jgi:plastocyanin